MHRPTWPLVLLFSVLLGGCASTKPQHVYVPAEIDGTKAFYTNGRPYAIHEGRCGVSATAIQPLLVAQKPFLGILLWYQNVSADTVLIEPLSWLRVLPRTESDDLDALKPIPPSTLIGKLANEASAIKVFRALGGVLEAAAAQPTVATSSLRAHGRVIAESSVEIGDVALKQADALDRATRDMNKTDRAYAELQSGISYSALRRNTLLPGAFVSGVIYFPVPDKEPATKLFGPAKNAPYTFELQICSPCEQFNILYSPADGE